jgi:hypothetical protein
MVFKSDPTVPSAKPRNRVCTFNISSYQSISTPNGCKHILEISNWANHKQLIKKDGTYIVQLVQYPINLTEEVCSSTIPSHKLNKAHIQSLVYPHIRVYPVLFSLCPIGSLWPDLSHLPPLITASIDRSCDQYRWPISWPPSPLDNLSPSVGQSSNMARQVAG